jgi:hypothetical protein
VSLYEKRWIYYFLAIKSFYTDVLVYCKEQNFPLFNIEIKGNEWSAINCDAMFECYTEEEVED